MVRWGKIYGSKIIGGGGGGGLGATSAFYFVKLCKWYDFGLISANELLSAYQANLEW